MSIQVRLDQVRLERARSGHVKSDRVPGGKRIPIWNGRPSAERIYKVLHLRLSNHVADARGACVRMRVLQGSPLDIRVSS